MKLRTRVVVTTLALVVPMVLALIWLDARSRHDAAERALVHITRIRMEMPAERARCEADAAGWGEPRSGGPPAADGPPGPGRPPPDDGMGPPPPPREPRSHRPPDAPLVPPRFFAFTRALAATNPAAPRLPAEVHAALAAGAGWVPVERRTWSSDVMVAVAMAWTDGPCAVVVARGSTEPGVFGSILPATPVWLVPMLAVLIAVLIAVGPVVRRIRRLTHEVQASARGGFVAPPTVTGRDEVTELGAAFAQASDEVRRQLAARDDRERALREYLGNTTHDVMIPLTVLVQHLSSLRGPASARDPATTERTIGSALDEAHFMAALIHNLSVAATLEGADVQLERSAVDLGALVERVSARHRPIARERGIELAAAVPEAPLRVDADLTMLEQAVSNLVHNAVRYGRDGGHVAIVLEPDGDRRFVLRVLDDGPGIPPGDLDRLVERGFRGDEARGRTAAGHGIGLHITHRVAQLHALELRFANRDEGGLEVTLRGPTLATSA